MFFFFVNEVSWPAFACLCTVLEKALIVCVNDISWPDFTGLCNVLGKSFTEFFSWVERLKLSLRRFFLAAFSPTKIFFFWVERLKLSLRRFFLADFCLLKSSVAICFCLASNLTLLLCNLCAISGGYPFGGLKNLPRILFACCCALSGYFPFCMTLSTKGLFASLIFVSTTPLLQLTTTFSTSEGTID